MLNPDPYIETFSGELYYFNNPKFWMINAFDIAHALSRICRFTGHTTHFYSVASHSLLVASLVPDEYKLQALLHDATEAYVGDVSSPLKALLGKTYSDLEDKARSKIAELFCMDEEIPNIVKLADRHALYLEAKYLFPPHERKTDEYWLTFKQPGFAEVMPGECGGSIEVTEKIFLDAIERWSK
jgi:hypothetical protein